MQAGNESRPRKQLPNSTFSPGCEPPTIQVPTLSLQPRVQDGGGRCCRTPWVEMSLLVGQLVATQAPRNGGDKRPNTQKEDMPRV